MNTERARSTVSPRNSIKTRIVGVSALVLLIVLATNVVIYSRINTMVERIDTVYASNVRIGELTDLIGTVENSVYEYLTTKSSQSLEDYYRYSQEFRDLIRDLNDRNTSSEIKMLEKNIRFMSESYLDITEETVLAKRGRNVERYRELYDQQSALFFYINLFIENLNNLQFGQNSQHYQILLSAMGILETLSFVVIFLVVIFCLVADLLIISSMIGPLTSLSEAARQVADGNFEVQLPEPTQKDEIGVVTGAFRQMVASIRAYIERVRTSMETEARMKERELAMEANLKEAQLKFLQAQINPHFLYNSLNAGAQLAMLEDADSTGDFLARMADFFRYNVKHQDGTSTLAEEVEAVDTYLYILNVRFAGDITYEKHIEEGIGPVRMPGMILQPLVENAVTHGIRDMLDRGRITLNIERSDDMLVITVADNGIGMTPARIAQVMSGGTAQADNGSTGIGLENVRNRLSLYYNQEDLLTVHSDGTGCGTEVVVTLPIRDDDAGTEKPEGMRTGDAGLREETDPAEDAGETEKAEVETYVSDTDRG